VRFEPHSYGFRPERSTQEAIRAIARQIEHQPCFVLDADLEAAFDHVNHAALLEKLQTTPALRQAITAWLKAGVRDGKTFLPSEAGLAQGGVLSPLLMNITLHGMEAVVANAQPANHGLEPPLLVRYGDDFVVLHPDLHALHQAATRLRQWLSPLGLNLNVRKTRIVHTLTPYQGQAGFDFLGFTLRHYPVEEPPSNGFSLQAFLTRWFAAPQPAPRFALVITPSEEASKRHLTLLSQRLVKLQAAPQAQVIRELNPLIAGWAAYYRELVSEEALSRFDQQVEQLLLNWASKRHPDQGRDWLATRYWRRGARQGRVFATPEGMPLRLYRQATKEKKRHNQKGD
jgi:RNA-directed DNA polymerase